MRLRAHHKLFLSYSILVAGVVIALTLGVEATLRQPLMDQAAEDLQRELSLSREIFDHGAITDPDELARHLAELTGHRVTIIARDGLVLGDSGVEPDHVAALENHLDREEVRGALETGAGVSVRHSVSVDSELLYAAMPTERGPVIRLAVGIEQIDRAVAGVRRQILGVGLVALLLAGVLSFGFSLVVTRPLRRMRDTANAMAAGDLDRRVGDPGRDGEKQRSDELGELGNALDTLATELQRRIGQLETEREEMQALIDSMVEGVLALGADGRVRRANPAARLMFGLSESYRGLPPEGITRIREFRALVESALAGEAPRPIEFIHQGRHLLATGQALPRGGAVVVLLDTSDLRRLEGVRRDFVANASHELKTPLTAIRGYAETLDDDDLPDELRVNFTRSLRSNADRLQAILEDLLDLSRIESGGWTVRSEPLTVTDVVRHSWEPFRERAEDGEIGFRIEVDEGATVVHADHQAVRQILSNLFSNALRYTPSGGRIEVIVSPDSHDMIRLEVRDTGTGIPSAHLARVFERFYRVDPARSREEGGTGLGLAIVRHLVERHGGEVEALSEPGGGTTIRFTLPRRPSRTPSSPHGGGTGPNPTSP